MSLFGFTTLATQWAAVKIISFVNMDPPQMCSPFSQIAVKNGYSESKVDFRFTSCLLPVHFRLAQQILRLIWTRSPPIIRPWKDGWSWTLYGSQMIQAIREFLRVETIECSRPGSFFLALSISLLDLLWFTFFHSVFFRFQVYFDPILSHFRCKLKIPGTH